MQAGPCIQAHQWRSQGTLFAQYPLDFVIPSGPSPCCGGPVCLRPIAMRPIHGDCVLAHSLPGSAQLNSSPLLSEWRAFLLQLCAYILASGGRDYRHSFAAQWQSDVPIGSLLRRRAFCFPQLLPKALSCTCALTLWRYAHLVHSPQDAHTEMHSLGPASLAAGLSVSGHCGADRQTRRLRATAGDI